MQDMSKENGMWRTLPIDLWRTELEESANC